MLFELEPKLLVVLECKLTDTAGARSQLSRLYKPVLEMGFPRRRVRLVVVTRHLTRETELGLVVGSLREALAFDLEKIPTLHWLGKGPI